MQLLPLLVSRNTSSGKYEMNNTFLILTIVLIVIAIAMILIILVQRPQGGGLAAAFGGAGGGGTDTVFGGRVGDALTVMTVVAFILFLGTAVALNLVESKGIIEEEVAPAALISTDATPATATTAEPGTFTGNPITDGTSEPISNNSDHPTSTDSSGSEHPTGGN
ncbi:MAG TPA: preprotein translocase subunit SecG [Phycisphaerales bacterium]|nr:preprotein translocase subunit SecG [Phycisphaerales bacterium]HIB49697.1 preprotein translocase subunit SecG [Phycisphaerales bacterium]HIN84572.1 preprotein translocase subunit SecG [Phycisphaerales bacterium]HIO20706.1 preprotein translocase subunit SecG [Phycisphaerales bacterium]HIO52909.1 preprotein translocase subunit SecG [Phycisphaerales bacterium]